MTRFAIGLVSLLLSAAVTRAENPRVELEVRDYGSIVIELFEREAPITVASFLEVVADGFYDQTIFHRVIRGFMVQGGGVAVGGTLKPTDIRLKNEADNGLKNVRGTVAMARRGDPHSASVQFFVNLVDNRALNHRDKSQRGWGYTVFGRVVEGMEVVDQIATAEVRRSQLSEAEPVKPIVLERATVVAAAEN